MTSFLKFYNQKGFTIVELIITVAILSFGVVGVYGAFVPVISISYTISSRLTAAYLAQEGMEIVRNIRDTNIIRIAEGEPISWSDGLVDCELGCQLDYRTGTATEESENQLKAYDDNNYLLLSGDGFYSYSDGDLISIFKRKVTVIEDESNSDIIKVTVEVMWDYNGQPYSFQTTEFLYNWK